MKKCLVIIPTYREEENVEKMIRMTLSFPTKFHLLIVDDNSPDRTATIVKSLIQEFPDRLFIEEREGKLGLGTAYIHGFKWALEHSYEYIFEMDCDFSHNPNDLERLLEPHLEGKCELSIGSRYCKGGKVKDWPLNRILLSYFASVYVRMVLWINIRDTTAGFMCYHHSVLRSMDLTANHFKGYAFQIYMKYAAVKKGFRIKEVPITFIDREAGFSKMSPNIFKEALWGVWKMRKMKF